MKPTGHATLSALPAQIEAAKLRDYLLSPVHPRGRTKARFFHRLGFQQDDWPLLRNALVDHLRRGVPRALGANAYGQKYIVQGMIHGPRASAPLVSVWIVPHRASTVRFVTAYPG